MSLLDRIQKLAAPESVVTVDGIKYRIVGKSGLDAASIATTAEAVNKKRKQAGLKKLSLDYFYLAECVSDAEASETLTPEQWAIIPRKHTAPLTVEVMRLNGLDDEDIERDPKESSTTET
jgi:hypothetical protein